MNFLKLCAKVSFFASVLTLFFTLPTVAQTTSLPKFGHVFIVVEENTGYSSVVGSSSMPYLNSLISQYGLATNYIADTHPSIGNYFVLTTGQILTNNDSQTPSTFPISEDNIIRELISAGKTWKDYAENLPSVGYTGGNSGNYYVRHNPIVYFTDVNTSAIQLQNVVPFTQFAADLANGNLPDFSFIAPNACDDAHNCSLSTADKWLQTNIDPLVKSALFQKDGLLIIVFDEDSSTSGTRCTDSMIQSGTWCGGRVAAVIVSPFLTSAGFKSNGSYHHENVLRLMAQGLGLTTFPGVSASADNMSDFFGSGIASNTPTATLSTNSLNFGSQNAGSTSPAKTITLTNTGSAALSISGIAANGDYSESSDCGSSLAVNTHCSISVSFSPRATGDSTGQLTISDNAPNSPQRVSLSGMGAGFSLSPQTTGQTISGGGTANYGLVLTPEGGFNQTVALTCSGVPQGSTCTVQPASVALDGTHSVAVSVKVTTTADARTGVAAFRNLPSAAPPAPLGALPMAAWLALFSMLGFAALAKVDKASARLKLHAPLAMLALVVILEAACGGTGMTPSSFSSANATPAGTYTLTVTAKSGSQTLSNQVTLSVR